MESETTRRMGRRNGSGGEWDNEKEGEKERGMESGTTRRMMRRNGSGERDNEKEGEKERGMESGTTRRKMRKKGEWRVRQREGRGERKGN